MPIQILDCSIRDGGYVNNWHFDKGLVREVYRALSKGGVDMVELGFRSSEKYFDPKVYGRWRFSLEEDLAEVTEKIRGARICVMGDYGRIDLEDLPERRDSVVDMLRVAVHKTHVFKAIDFLEKAKAKGYRASLQCMGYSVYSDGEKADLLAALKKTALDCVYIADSYGSILPFQMQELFEPVLELGASQIGFHPHNNIQMAFANTLEAIRLGVQIVDTTIYGIGRGAGNLPTEILLSYLQLQGNEKYNVIPVLNCIERYFLDLMKETPWGYQLPYMISGIFNSHPNYSKELLRRREYSMEDIWKALGCVRELRPVGFDPGIVDALVHQGVIGRGGVPADCRQIETATPAEPETAPVYLKRHTGRDFLVLANGPTLKTHKKAIDDFIARNDPVVLGANFLNGLFEPDYHAFNNKKRFVAYVNTVSPKSGLLIGANIPGEMVDDYVDRSYERLLFQDILDADFDIDRGVITSNCRTISVLLAGVAVVMGAERVFIAGMDGYLNVNDTGSLFYREKFDTAEHELNVERHRWNEKFLHQIDGFIREQGGEGLHILTPTGHSAFYKSIEHYI